MKCDWVKENVIFYVYDELADDARYELEQHVARCAECAEDLKATQKMRAALPALVEEPSPNLLASSRMRLQEVLESADQGGFWRRLVFDPGAWLRQIRFAPALAAAIFIVGFGGGITATYMAMKGNPGSVPPQFASLGGGSSQIDTASITGIRSVTQEPGSDRVKIQYDTIKTNEEAGSVNDKHIQQLLLLAARGNMNSGVRVDSVDLLTQRLGDAQVREALAYSLRYDANPGVRLKALEGLGAYVKNDMRVRDAVLRALMDDTNPGVRTQALHLLEPVRADSSVRAVLTRLSETDDSAYIRAQTRAMLAQLPEID